MKITRATDLFPQVLIDELLRVRRLGADWIEWNRLDDGEGTYEAKIKDGIDTPLHKFAIDGASIFGLKALAEWLFLGPKIFYPTQEQQDALKQIDINLNLTDYSQPYPALLIALDIPPFNSCLVVHEPESRIIIASLYSAENKEDITTTIADCNTENLIEDSIRKFDTTVPAAMAALAPLALHVALNSCLALSNFESRLAYLLPKEVERDRKTGREHSERGLRARRRVSLALQVATFAQEIALHRSESSQSHPESESNPTGRAMPPHWRRGHWRMQAWGPKLCFRKRVLIPPVMVRKDLFIGDASDTQVAIRS